jgi:hypothetical protein
MHPNAFPHHSRVPSKEPYLMEIVGLLKFFRETTHLEALLSGHIYCNTPEHYRLSGVEGVGDRNESCVASYRIERDGKKTVLEIDGNEVSGVMSATMHNGMSRDMYLHCWFVVSMPKNDLEYKSLVSDINRIRDEFGAYYVFLEAKNIQEFRERIVEKYDLIVNCVLVSYSENSMDWSVGCKSDKYSYQREFRFCFSECNLHSVEPLSLQSDKGFSDLLHKNEIIRIVDQETRKVLFFLDSNGCYCK